MKKLFTILFFVAALNAGAQNYWRAPSVFEQWVAMHSTLSLNSSTDTLYFRFSSTRWVANYSTQFISFGTRQTNIGSFSTNGYTVGAGIDNIDLHQADKDTILITFSGDTAHINGQHNIIAWDFQPPLLGGGTGYWTKTGNAIYPTTIGDSVGIGTSSPIGKLNVSFDPTLERVVFGSPFTGKYFIYGDIRDFGSTSFFGVAGVDKADITDTSAFTVKSLNGSVGMDAYKIGESVFAGFYAYSDGGNAKSNIYTQNVYSDGSIGNDRNRIQCDSSGISVIQFSNNNDTIGNYRSGFFADTIHSEMFVERYAGERTTRDGKGILVDSANFEYFVNGSTKFSVDTTGSVSIIDGTQGAGKVLTSDSQGLASWVTPEYRNIIYDSLTALIGETVSLANNTTTIIASSGTVTSVTWSFPTGSTGDVLDVENMLTITTLNITGTGTGTITAAKITNTKTAGLKTFHNYGGNWY